MSILSVPKSFSKYLFSSTYLLLSLTFNKFLTRLHSQFLNGDLLTIVLAKAVSALNCLTAVCSWKRMLPSPPSHSLWQVVTALFTKRVSKLPQYIPLRQSIAHICMHVCTVYIGICICMCVCMPSIFVCIYICMLMLTCICAISPIFCLLPFVFHSFAFEYVYVFMYTCVCVYFDLCMAVKLL